MLKKCVHLIQKLISEMCIREKEGHAYVKKNYFTGLINQELPCSITQSESNFARDTRKNISRGTHTGMRN